jgi:hypothetical protein
MGFITSNALWSSNLKTVQQVLHLLKAADEDFMYNTRQVVFTYNGASGQWVVSTPVPGSIFWIELAYEREVSPVDQSV